MNRPGVGVAVIIKKGNKVLFGKRLNSHGSNSWHFPGGHIEMKESLKDTAKRETKEEVGIEIKNIKYLATTNDIFADEYKHYVTLFMLADYASGEVKIMEPEKAESWDWYEWDKLPKPYFLPVENFMKLGIDPFANEDK